MNVLGDYTRQASRALEDLLALRQACVDLGLEASVDDIDRVVERLGRHTFNVAVVGEFKRGKSTLINALLGQSVLPADILPCSATLNRVSYGEHPGAVIEHRDGSREKIDIDSLSDYVTKLTPESEERARDVRCAEVAYPLEVLKDGVTIIDTPGLNDDAAMTEVTLSVLPEADAAIMVLMCDSPFSETEREFLEQRILASDLGRVLFVVTGIDRYEPDELERLLELMRRRIADSALLKVESVYGKDSEKHAALRRKVADVRLYPVSSKDALRAKRNGDRALLEDSRFSEFEQGLADLIMDGRGGLQLSVAASVCGRVALEVLGAIELRASASDMGRDEFESRHREAMDAIERIRQEREAELQRIARAAERCKADLEPRLTGFWDEVRAAGHAAIDAFEVDVAKVNNTAANKEERDEMRAGALASAQEAMQRAAQLLAERIQGDVERAASEEATRLEGFEESFLKATQDVRSLFDDTDIGGEEDAREGSRARLARYWLPITTSAMDGYADGGWKGALLGGGLEVTNFAIIVSGFSALTGVALTMAAAPIAIPLGLVGACFVETASTKLVERIYDKFYGDVKVTRFRDQLKEVVDQYLNQQIAESDYTSQVRSYVDALFEGISQEVRDGTEATLEDALAQMRSLQDVSGSGMSEEEEARLSAIGQKAQEVLGRQSALARTLEP